MSREKEAEIAKWIGEAEKSDENVARLLDNDVWVESLLTPETILNKETPIKGEASRSTHADYSGDCSRSVHRI